MWIYKIFDRVDTQAVSECMPIKNDQSQVKGEIKKGLEKPTEAARQYQSVSVKNTKTNNPDERKEEYNIYNLHIQIELEA